MKTYRTAVGIATLVLLLGACGEPETNEDEEEATIAAPPGEVAAGPHDTESEESEESGDVQALEEAVALASAYLEARNAYDVEGARQLVADEFRTDEPPDGYSNLATIEPAFELHQAFGFQSPRSSVSRAKGRDPTGGGVRLPVVDRDAPHRGLCAVAGGTAGVRQGWTDLRGTEGFGDGRGLVGPIRDVRSGARSGVQAGDGPGATARAGGAP
jgi:hypothetical protein